MVFHKLPIGIQSFSEIRAGGYAYVDTTPFLAVLFSSGKYYFLSRPAGWEKSFSRHLGIKFYAFRLNTMAWMQGMTSSDPFNPSGFGLKVFFFRQDI